MAEKEILRLIPKLQAIALVKGNLKVKKAKPVKRAVKGIVGINLIKTTADVVESY